MRKKKNKKLTYVHTREKKNLLVNVVITENTVVVV